MLFNHVLYLSSTILQQQTEIYKRKQTVGTPDKYCIHKKIVQRKNDHHKHEAWDTSLNLQRDTFYIFS